MKRIALVTLVFVVGAVLTGCGDDKEALSQEEFLKQGNAICAAGNERLDAAFTKAFGDLGEGEEPDPEAIGALLEDVLVPEVQGQIDDFGDLEPPDDLADDMKEFLDNAQGALDQLEQQAKDDPGAVFEGEDPFAEVNAQADKIGLTECSDDGDGG